VLGRREDPSQGDRPQIIVAGHPVDEDRGKYGYDNQRSMDEDAS
jgi:hypothetical protein